MKLVKVGIANIDTKVKVFRSNADKAIKVAEDAGKENYTVVAFPEQTFLVTPPKI